jgi:hypothetical protein
MHCSDQHRLFSRTSSALWCCLPSPRLETTRSGNVHSVPVIFSLLVVSKNIIYMLIAWDRVLFQKLRVTQVVKKIPLNELYFWTLSIVWCLKKKKNWGIKYIYQKITIHPSKRQNFTFISCAYTLKQQFPYFLYTFMHGTWSQRKFYLYVMPIPGEWLPVSCIPSCMVLRPWGNFIKTAVSRLPILLHAWYLVPEALLPFSWAYIPEECFPVLLYCDP